MAAPLAGKVAIVTGSAGELGRALVARITAEGARVAGVDAGPSPGAALSIIADVSGVNDARRIAATVDAELGGIDILVNTAGRWKLTPVDGPREQALADYAELIGTNTRGPFLLQRAVVASMIERGGGDIVNLSIPDVLPPRGGDRTNPPQTDLFNASKWALNGFTQAWALALRKRDIRVNALAIGATGTPTVRGPHAQLLVDLLTEGREGRTGETIGWWPGEPVALPLRRARGEEIRVTAELALTDVSAWLARAEARLARLEAKEAVLSTFNEYLYHLDVGYPAELVDAVFTTDAVLEVVNFPPGTMRDLTLTGHAEILPLYTDHTRTAPAIQGGHHAANIAVDVASDLSVAHLSAYFMTSVGAAGWVQGGQYQGEAVADGDRWRFRRFRILSGWGWRVTDVLPITAPLPAERALRGGRPAAYTPRS